MSYPPEAADPLRRWIEQRDETALAQAPAAVAVAATLNLASAAAAGHPDIDADELLSAGFALLRSGHATVAARGLATWLLQQPTTARLDVVALLLQGLWVHQGAGGQQAQPEAVEALLQVCNQGSARDGVCPSAWLALAQALPAIAAPPLRARVIESLRQAAQAQSTSTALREHLRAQVGKAMKGAKGP